MKNIRVFVAIEISESLRAALSDLQGRLKMTGADIRWVRPESIHLTLAFVGDIPRIQIEPLKAALNASVREKAFDFNVTGIGTFGNLRNPRVLWAGISPCPALEHLRRQTVEALGTAGVDFDDKAFSPHLTIGRFKSPRNLSALKQQLEKEKSGNFGSEKAQEVQLIKSELRPDGAKYTVLFRFPLRENQAP
jgi:RNA 2',3'-cyclic 3'-phosphodiesterase